MTAPARVALSHLLASLAAATLGCLHASDPGGNDSEAQTSDEPTPCGDGTCDADETPASCPADCEPAPPPNCGDARVDADEECDSVAEDTPACDHDCTFVVCGDGLVNMPAGELCDDGPANSDEHAPTMHCSASCAGPAPYCGDGSCQPGAEDASSCPDDCDAVCGNGVPEPGEACDAGEDSPECDADCSAIECGDLYINTAAETCDDGNLDDADACTASCQAATCGDGVVWSGVEACDDGNQINDDACSDTCVLPRRIFVTSAAYKGDLKPALGAATGLALGDAHCQALAEAAALPGTFLAWLSDADDSPATRFDTAFTGAYQQVDGTVIASDGWADLVDGTLAHPIDLDEHGELATGENVWTNTSADGTAAGAQHCLGWTSIKVTDKSIIGVSDATDSTWTSVVDIPCSTPARLYCVEQ